MLMGNQNIDMLSFFDKFIRLNSKDTIHDTMPVKILNRILRGLMRMIFDNCCC